MRKDENGDDLIFEKVADLYKGMSVWKVSIDLCREQDKNAQVMDKASFDRLKSNIEKDSRLESLPLGYIENKAPNVAAGETVGHREFIIISGHHRLRAARMANIKVVFVMAYDIELSHDEIVSKQLAHNALVGTSDTQVLKELFDSIRDIDQKVASGIRDSEFDGLKFRPISADAISIDFQFKCVKIIFLQSQAEKFDMVLSEIDPDDKVYIGDIATFDKFTKTVRGLSKNEDIRNIASLLDRMCDIVRDYTKNNPRKDERAGSNGKQGGSKVVKLSGI